MARGSRYRIEGQLIGPGVMDQLSWIDIAKAHLHIGQVVPFPDRAIADVVATTDGDGDVITEEPGDIVRIINSTAAPLYILFSPSAISGMPTSANEDNTLVIGANSEIIMVLPPANHSFVKASATGIRLEFTSDS